MRSSRCASLVLVASLFAAAPALAQGGLVVQQHTTFEIARIASGDLNQTVQLNGAQQQKTTTQGRSKFLLFSRDASGTEIVRLDQGKLYSIDDKKKSYKVQDFAEVRAEMEKAQKEAEKANARDARDTDDARLYVTIDDVKKTGEKKTINGFQTEQSVLRMTVMAENKKTGEKAPLFVLTGDFWLDASQHQAMRANQAFATAYAQQLGLDPGIAGNPYARWIGELQKESAKLQGYPILSTITMEAAEDAQSGGAQKSEPAASGTPTSPGDAVGKALGGLMRRAKDSKKEESASSSRPVLFRSTTEVKSISTAAPAASEFEVPAGYKQG
jgi:hypothetical protein